MGVRSRPRAIGSGRERTPAAATRRLCRQVSLPPPSRGREEKDNSENIMVSVQLRDREAVGLGADLHRFLAARRSEEHTSELQSLMRISYAVFCFNKKSYR